MKDECHLPGEAASLGGISLRVIWDVDAGADYGVERNGAEKSVLVAIRTLDGCGKVRLSREREFSLPGGSLLLVEKDGIRGYHPEDGRWRFWWFEFESGGVLPGPLNQLLPVEEHPSDVDDFANVCLWLKRESSSQRTLAAATFSMMFCRWLASWENSEKRKPYRRTVEQVIDLMNSRIDGGLGLREMAAVAHLSQRRFRQVFESVTGCSPKRFYDRLRLSVGREMLEQGAFNVSETADRLGFSSAFHFSKAFRKHFGHPPSKHLQ